MNTLWGNAIGVMIVIIMLVFIGIWIWAWRSRHAVTFDRLSALPMEDTVTPSVELESAPQRVSENQTSQKAHAGKGDAGRLINTEQPHLDDKGSCS